MRNQGYTGNLLADAYTSPSLLEGFETSPNSTYNATTVKSVPMILEPFVLNGKGNGGSASYTLVQPDKSSSFAEFTLPRVRYSAIRGNSAFLKAVAKDLGAYARLPAELFMNIEFSAAANGSTLALLSLPVSATGGSASATGGSASASGGSASATGGSASASVDDFESIDEGFLATPPPNFELILYELQAELNTDNFIFNAVNTYLIENTAAIWTPTASESPSNASNNKLNFGVVSGAGGGGGGGGGGDYDATRKQMEDGATGDSDSTTGPPIINETIIIQRPEKSDQPTFTGNFFVDLTNEIVSDAASVLSVFAGLFNFFNPPKPVQAKVASASATATASASHTTCIHKKRHATVPSEHIIYNSSEPTAKFANKPKEVLDADGNVYLKTEGDTSNDPVLSDKERRSAWRKVYPKGGR
jgi:hypothetical protein